MVSEKTDLKTSSDEYLVECAQAHDKAAFAKLVDRYERKVYNLGLRILGNPEDASDVLQDTFFQVLKKIDTFRGESKFSTWLYRIATNTALMKKRKEKYRKVVSIDEPYFSNDGDEMRRQFKDDWSRKPLDEVESQEFTDKLKEAILSVPIEYRVPLILRDINDLSNEEVAKIMKLSLPAVKSRVHRARLYLRDRLSEYFSGKSDKGDEDGS